MIRNGRAWLKFDSWARRALGVATLPIGSSVLAAARPTADRSALRGSGRGIGSGAGRRRRGGRGRSMRERRAGGMSSNEQHTRAICG